MARVVLPEWRNRWRETKYPFADNASLVNAAGIAVSQDLFDDARIHPVGGTDGAYLDRITVTGGLLTFGIASGGTELATGTVDLANPPTDVVKLTDAHGRPAGVLVSDAARLAGLASTYGEGTNAEFTATETPFVPSVVVPVPNFPVRGVLLDDGTLLAGDIWLVGGPGVVLRKVNGNIRIDLLGDPYAKRKACEAAGTEVAPFCGLRTINGIGPDELGDFKLVLGSKEAADNILRIEQKPGTVRMRLAANRELGPNGEATTTPL